MVDAALHDLAVRRLVATHLAEWRLAYDEFRGPGSTRRRAATIHGIYDSAAPLPDAVMTSPSMTFLTEIRRIVTSAIEATGPNIKPGFASLQIQALTGFPVLKQYRNSERGWPSGIKGARRLRLDPDNVEVSESGAGSTETASNSRGGGKSGDRQLNFLGQRLF